ncbi:50S ribosomal protein L35 [Telmatocola sphagniphila]|jgi:large subunit ribosomal protein L35|uniref:Large ribosomal subunit protein bL35 n=1 Tax=Telmatocola sphagniphila TaxID=1123043 RepID=A0A8E6F0G6_9BACT|nr:50S ribosomal protein L35 [Telmatocola sphagniphila]QVL34511.1 50S ribosomal protein L35 [Telmatocola sphagniphila]
MATKNKTNRSLAKRFKISGTGKLLSHSPAKRHLLSGRTSKRKRQLSRTRVGTDATAQKYITAMGG